jgi:hypothetical protein
MPGIGGGGSEGHGSPFRGVTGVLRSHTAHQEGSECLVPYVNQRQSWGSAILIAPQQKEGSVWGCVKLNALNSERNSVIAW